MPRSILNEREICAALKGQRNKTRLHPVWGHCDLDCLCPTLYNPLYLIGMERFFLGMISFFALI